jgi:hypothetical protein
VVEVAAGLPLASAPEEEVEVVVVGLELALA